ncbi:MAG TPA: discoidin domain-containing protein [Treponemataceae bacterium]|nr:discoidin domain-containing protein [Treponemataceae bacterium]HPS44445.1 discoidin domain-containing protein [Treponemataceae bacterium]
MKKSLLAMLCLSLCAFALPAQSNWFRAQTDEAAVASVTATSELVEGQYDGKYLYPPVNILDGDFSTTWCENDPSGPGIGESITVELEAPVSFDELEIVNGFASGNDLYGKNNRVKGIQLTQTAGKHFQQKEYALKDNVPGWQSIKFDLLQTARTITIKITDVYRGSKYNDTCLCDIRLLYKGKVIPFKNVERIKAVQEENSRYALKNSAEDFRKRFFGLFQKYHSDTLDFVGADPEDSLSVSISGNQAADFEVQSLGHTACFKSAPKDSLKAAIQKYLNKNYGNDYSADDLRFFFDYDQSKTDWVSLTYDGWIGPSRVEYTLGNARIINTAQVDYVDVTTVTLVKVDGDTVFFNGVPYKVLDPSRVVREDFGDNGY